LPIKVVIVDDHALVRAVLVDLLNGVDDIDVVATCTDGSEVVQTVARTHPDVVLMDLQMPKKTGLEATRELLAARPEARVVVLTGDFSRANANAAKSAGAVGFLLKGEDPQDLPEQIRAVAAGGTAWSSTAAAALTTCN